MADSMYTTHLFRSDWIEATARLDAAMVGLKNKRQDRNEDVGMWLGCLEELADCRRAVARLKLEAMRRAEACGAPHREIGYTVGTTKQGVQYLLADRTLF